MSAWRTTSLGEIAESVEYGVTASASQQPIGPKFLRISDIQNGSVSWPSVPWCTCNARAASKARLKSGDIVFARTGATTGKSFLIRDCPTDAVFASYLIRLRLGDRACPSFVSHYFTSPAYWAQITKSARGVAQAGVNATTLRSVAIPLPPLPEQRRIAAILDKVNDLRAKRRAALAQLDSLAQSIFHEMFGDPLHDRSKYLVSPLIDLVDRARPISYGILKPGPDTLDGVPYVRVIDMKGGSIDLSNIRHTTYAISNQFRRSLLKAGDLLLSIRGHVGRLAIVPSSLEGANITQDTARLAIQNALPEFVCACLRSTPYQRWMQRHTKGVAVRGINLADVKAIPMVVPPPGLQAKFKCRLESIEKLVEAGRSSLNELDDLFASLQHRAFRGEL